LLQARKAWPCNTNRCKRWSCHYEN